MAKLIFNRLRKTFIEYLGRLKKGRKNDELPGVFSSKYGNLEQENLE